MTTKPKGVDERLSVEEFQSLPEEEGYRLELSRGRVVREPAPGPRHGHLTGRLSRTLAAFAEDDGLGLVFVDAGTRLVWIVDPAERTVTDHRGRDDIRILDGGDALEGSETLPGFSLALNDLFG